MIILLGLCSFTHLEDRLKKTSYLLSVHVEPNNFTSQKTLFGSVTIAFYSCRSELQICSLQE